MQDSLSICVPEPSCPTAGPGAALASGEVWGAMTHMERERLGRDHRLRASREYSLIKATGTPLRGRHCLLLALSVPGSPTKLGFIASKKGVGGAVQRNRARRRIREIVRRRWTRVPKAGYWLVFVAFRSALTASHQDLASDIERLLAGAGALGPSGIGNR